MKNIKVQIISFMTIFCILSQFIIPFNISNSSNSEEIYDVILFWGESNILGGCGTNTLEESQDTRYNTNSLLRRTQLTLQRVENYYECEIN